MVNVGIIGLGFMAATHIKAYRKLADVRIAAICNPSGRRLDGDFSDVTGNVGDQQPVRLDMSQVTAYRSYEEMLANPEIQLIDICTPTMSHLDLACAALQAGKHVLCEKPLARNSAQARQMVAAVTKAKTYLMPAMCLRFFPEWNWLKQAIAEKTYGRVLSARFRRVAQPPGWGVKDFLNGERSGGALLDLHIHDVDFIQYCFGRPRSVFATGYSQLSGAIDHVVTQYRFDHGPIVHAEGTWAFTEGFGFNASYTVNFENATADYDLARPNDTLRLFEKGQAARTIKCEGEDGYVGELAHLINAIQTQTPPSIVTVKDALSAIEICEAEEHSVKTGQIVTL